MDAVDKKEVHPQAKYVHVIVLSLSLIQMLFILCVMVDGRAVATLKEHGPNLLTCWESKANPCGDYTGKDIWRFPYGMGAAYDQYHMHWYQYGGYGADEGEGTPGKSRNLKDEWDYTYALENGAYVQDKSIFDRVLTAMQQDNVPHNLAAYLDCGHMEKLGRCVQAFSYIAFITVGVQILASAAHNADLFDSKGVSLLLQLLAFISFLIVTIGIAALYNMEWVCHNPLIPKIILMDHFDINYAIAFTVVGMAIPPINTIFISLWAEGTTPLDTIGADPTETEPAGAAEEAQ